MVNTFVSLLNLLVLSLIYSCHFNQSIQFSETPKIVKNPNHTSPLTAYINFKSKQQVDSVILRSAMGTEKQN